MLPKTHTSLPRPKKPVERIAHPWTYIRAALLSWLGQKLWWAGLRCLRRATALHADPSISILYKAAMPSPAELEKQFRALQERQA